MELLFVTLGGAILGLGARYVLPKRATYGALLVPAIGAAVAAAIWAALTWVGWKFDGGWIWWVSLVAAGIIALVFALVIPRGRATRDDRMLETLSRA